MTEKMELYKCEICGNVVEVVIPGEGELVCCGQPMIQLTAQKEESLNEKHLPFFEKSDDKLIVKVGSVPHPMIKEHYIQFIEVYSKDEKYIKRKYLEPDEEPILNLSCKDIGAMTARELCNIHGLWEASYD